ncbi:ATP-grasp domain-containing protein [Pseudoteredinibacter isoporae]|uniref:Glutathione synthase/RimK-type ligase-like ATP-grasp enzyme n=1 Tax=Pseudoteredinibacter isoporae TaxID=570281 RepID=A0A7X0MWP1_9GAMM|nr:RimK family alpha-L-glutamate ligase [Pseudoteredinibacter isoporae]MBB6522678.1 glutathione synthase/RimK-type ligase-like ATP-grasp enzyme [Pseudoteredinibacter isoporae]
MSDAQRYSAMETESYTPDNSEPGALKGLAYLMSRVFAGDDMSLEAQTLLQRAEQGEANALLDLSILLQLRGDEATAMAVQAEALMQQQHYQLIPRVHSSPLKVLALVAPGNLMSNTPLEFLADGAGFQLDLLYISPDLPRPIQLPEHDVAIVALSELERNRDTLHIIHGMIEDWPRPILNSPRALLNLGRDQISQRLQGLPGLDVPINAIVSRDQLTYLSMHPSELPQLLADAEFPLIVRPLDSHAGNDLACIKNAEALYQYLTATAGELFYLARFVDYRSEDGQFRKYRIMLIDGEPHLAHMAISDHWMVHYLNAGMLDSETKRQEEADTMAAFNHDFARRHREALKNIHQVSGLDYLGIDCGETLDGDLLVFEVGASMNVHAMDPVDIFPYKQPQMQRLFTAFESMLLREHLNFRIERRRASAPFGEPPRGEPGQAMAQ